MVFLGTPATAPPSTASLFPFATAATVAGGGVARTASPASIVAAATGELNVLDPVYAVPTDGTDARAALQVVYDAAAALAAVAGNAVTVRHPRATYTVNPTTRLKLGSHVTVALDDGATIRVMDDAGDYRTIFGAATDATYVTNVAIRGGRIDQNPAGNTTADIRTAVSGAQQRAVSFELFDNLTVAGVAFEDCCGVNTVLLAAPLTYRGARVLRCSFRFVKGVSSEAGGLYDNSAVYLECLDHEASGNYFYCPTLADRARAAIESHGGPSLVAGNRSNGYETLCNIVSQFGATPALDANVIVVTDNVVARCAIGFKLWCYTGRSLRGVTITGNTIGINNAERAAAGIDVGYCGIGTAYSEDGTLDGTLEGLDIGPNTVTFERESRAGGANEDGSGGVVLNQRGAILGAKIGAVLIVDSPLQGVRVHATGTNYEAIDIDGPTIVDAGNNTTATNQGVRCGLLLIGVLKVSRCRDVTLLDRGTPGPSGKYGIYNNVAAGSSLTIESDTIRTIQAATAGQLAVGGYATAPTAQPRSAFTLGASNTAVSLDAQRYRQFEYTLGAAAVGHTLNVYGGYVYGQPIEVTLINDSGGAGPTTTWDAATTKVAAWATPADGYRRTIRLEFTGTYWREIWRSGDIPN